MSLERRKVKTDYGKGIREQKISAHTVAYDVPCAVLAFGDEYVPVGKMRRNDPVAVIVGSGECGMRTWMRCLHSRKHPYE